MLLSRRLPATASACSPLRGLQQPPCRRFLHPSIRHLSPPSSSSRDDSHPHLFYHSIPSSSSTTASSSAVGGGRLALSFLPDEPVQGSRTVLGYLPMTPGAGLNDFKQNGDFLPLLHQAIKSSLEAGVAYSLQNDAMMRGSDGFLHLCDERNLPPSGRIPDPEDIIASVFVESGKLRPETYEAQPMYRLCTSDGVLTLPEGVDEHVMKVLEKVDREEKNSA